MNNFCREFKKYMNQNLCKIIVILICFLLGIVLSIFYINCLDESIKTELINYVEENNNIVIDPSYKINYFEIIIDVIVTNIVYVLIISLLGCSVLLSPLIYGIYLYKGFIIGISTSISILLFENIKGTLYSLVLMFLPNVVFIFMISVLSILWLNFSYSIIKDKNAYNIKRKIYLNMFISLIIYFLMIALLIPIHILIINIIDNIIKIL